MSSVDPNKLPDPSAPPVQVPEDQVPPPSYYALFPSQQQQQFLPPAFDHSSVPQPSVVLETVYVSVDQQQPQRQQTTRTHVESYCCHIVLACCVLWCCNWIFGIIAFVVAIVAGRTASTNGRLARTLGFVSIAISLGGIVMTAIVVAIVVTGNHSESSFAYITPKPTSVGGSTSSECDGYFINSSCYDMRRRLVCSSTVRPGRFTNANTLCHCAPWEKFSDGYCYWNDDD